jgi:hypothetical protein
MWFSCLLIASVIGFLPDFVPQESQWLLAIISRDAIVFLVSLAACIAIQKPTVKIVWFLWTVWQFVIFTTTLAEAYIDISLQFWVGLSAVMAMLFFGWASSRRPPIICEERLNKNYLYYVIKPTTDIRSLINSALSKPWNGLAVYVDGHYYGFKRKEFVKVKLDNKKLSKWGFVKVKKVSPEDIRRLNNMVGSSWRPWRNCYSVFEPMFGKLSEVNKLG